MIDIDDFFGLQTDNVKGVTYYWVLRVDQSATVNTQT